MNLEKYAKEFEAWKQGIETQVFVENIQAWIDVPKPSPKQFAYVLPDADIPWRIKPEETGNILKHREIIKVWLDDATLEYKSRKSPADWTQCKPASECCTFYFPEEYETHIKTEETGD